jgi:hypothetical protein
MHFLTSLISIFGFTLVLCFALVKGIGDPSKTSVHAPPDLVALQGWRNVESEQANTTDFYKTSNPQ